MLGYIEGTRSSPEGRQPHHTVDIADSYSNEFFGFIGLDVDITPRASTPYTHTLRGFLEADQRERAASKRGETDVQRTCKDNCGSLRGDRSFQAPVSGSSASTNSCLSKCSLVLLSPHLLPHGQALPLLLLPARGRQDDVAHGLGGAAES